MIHAVVSEHVNADAAAVRALYVNPQNWATVFSKTIRAAHVARRDGDAIFIEVDHAEGRVTNILRHVSPTRIELREFKRRYDATFLNDFISERDGMRFTLTASVFLKSPYTLAEPLLTPLVLRKMRRYVVEPLKRAAEDGLCRLTERPQSRSRRPPQYGTARTGGVCDSSLSTKRANGADHADDQD